MRLARWTAILGILGALLLTPGVMAPYALAKDNGKKEKKKEEKPKITINEAEIYYGDPADFTKPAVVDVDRVYMSIPEYKEVIDRDMDDSNPRYLMLMRTASKKFRKALKKAAKAKKCDLIGGLGSIKIKGKKVPEITDTVISSLPKK